MISHFVLASIDLPKTKQDFLNNGMLDSVAERLSTLVMKYSYGWNILSDELYKYLVIIDVDWRRGGYTLQKLEYHALKYFGVKFRVTKPDGLEASTRFVYSYLFDDSYNKYTLSYLLNVVNEKFHKLNVPYKIYLFNKSEDTLICDNWRTFNRFRLDATPLLNFNLGNSPPDIKIYGADIRQFVRTVAPKTYNRPFNVQDRKVVAPQDLNIVLDKSEEPPDANELYRVIYAFLSKRFFKANESILSVIRSNTICSSAYFFIQDYFAHRAQPLSENMLADIKNVAIAIGEDQASHDPKDSIVMPGIKPDSPVPEGQDPVYLQKLSKQEELRKTAREIDKKRRLEKQGISVAHGQLLSLAQNLDINLAHKAYPLMKKAVNDNAAFIKLYSNTANPIAADLESLDNTMYQIFKQQISGLVILPPTFKLIQDGVSEKSYLELTPKFKDKYKGQVEVPIAIDPIVADPNAAIEPEKDYSQMSKDEALKTLGYDQEHLYSMSEHEKNYLHTFRIPIEKMSDESEKLAKELFNQDAINHEFYDLGLFGIEGERSSRASIFFTDMFEAYYWTEDNEGTDDRMRIDRIEKMRKTYLMLKYEISAKDKQFVTAVVDSIPIDGQGIGANRFAAIIKNENVAAAYSVMITVYIRGHYIDFSKEKTWIDTRDYTPEMINDFAENDLPLPERVFGSNAETLKANWKKLIEM